MDFDPPSRPPSSIGQNVYGKGFISGALTEPAKGGTGASLHFSFALIDASNPDDGTQVLVVDGEINGELPTGMGGDDYFLHVTTDGDEIWAVITYDTDTLEITSRTLNSGGPTPDTTTFGTLYVRIGYVNIDTSGTSPVVTPHNTHCGDIDFRIMMGGVDGEPAAIAVPVFSDWIVIS